MSKSAIRTEAPARAASTLGSGQHRFSGPALAVHKGHHIAHGSFPRLVLNVSFHTRHTTRPWPRNLLQRRPGDLQLRYVFQDPGLDNRDPPARS